MQSSLKSPRNTDWKNLTQAGTRVDRSRALPGSVDSRRMATSPPMLLPAADAPTGAIGVPNRFLEISFNSVLPSWWRPKFVSSKKFME